MPPAIYFWRMYNISHPINSFETPRLILHELNPELWNYLHTHCDEETIKKFGGYSDAELAIEKEKFVKGLVNYNFSFRNYMMVEKASGNTIGRIGYHTWQPLHYKAEIGYGMLGDEYKNQGFSKEAMKIVLQQGFETMGLNRVLAMIGPQNIASINLVTRYGFVKEGLARQDYYKYGILHDSASYSLLKSEYDALKANW
jgi:Acetyltransferases, including N-acetylases of ribosomal proteins